MFIKVCIFIKIKKNITFYVYILIDLTYILPNMILDLKLFKTLNYVVN